MELKKRTVWLLLAFLLIAVVYMFSFDETLNPDAEALIEAINQEVSVKDNGMVYLLGMWSAQDRSPYQIGLERIHQFNKTRHLPQSELYDPLEDANSELWLKEINEEEISPLTCHFRKQACLSYIWENTSEIPALLTEYDLYIQRYNELLGYNSFRLPFEPHFSAPMTFHQVSLLAFKLKLLEAIYLVRAEEYAQGVSGLSALIDLNVNLIEQTPDMFTKVISVVHLETALEVVAFLLSNTPRHNDDVWTDVVSSASRFHPSFASSKRQLGVEFVAFVNAIKAHPDVSSFHEPSNQHTIAQSWLYKPNMTLNLFYKNLSESIDVYVWREGEIRQVKGVSKGRELSSIQITNYIGSLLVRTATPRYLNIEQEILELYFRLQVLKAGFEHRLLEQPQHFEALPLKSPYTGADAFQQGNQICFDGRNSEPLCYYF